MATEPKSGFSIHVFLGMSEMHSDGLGAGTVADKFPLHQQRVTSFVHRVIFFSQDVFSQQIVVGPTHSAEIELQLVISAAQIFEGESGPLTVQGPAPFPSLAS